MKPVFRNGDKIQVLPFREWLRNKMPNGKMGFVVEDLDLVIRWFGLNYGFDGQGAFMLTELKFGSAQLGIAQEKTFGLMNSLLRAADPNYERYLGFYLIQYTHEDWDLAEFKINFECVTREQFMNFWQRKHIVKPYQFKYSPVVS